MAAAASESFSGLFETDVTSIFIKDSRSISMTSILEEALPDISAAGTEANIIKLLPAKMLATLFRAIALRCTRTL